jgi:intein/homing endonuclease
MLDETTTRKIRESFNSGALKVRSVPVGEEVQWLPVKDVFRHKTPHKQAFKVTTASASVVATEDHSLFLVSSEGLVPTQASTLKAGDALAVVHKDQVIGEPVTSVIEVDSLTLSYDLSVPGPENFVLTNGVVAHNSYSIGGVSLDLDRASKYEGAASSASEQFDKMLEKAKATVNIIKGLQQPRYGMGVRSAFGPYSGRGVLSPRKFVGL